MHPTFRTPYGEALVVKTTYHGNKTTAIALVDAFTGSPIDTLSVNLPEHAHLLKKDQFFVRLTDDLEELQSDALQSGFFRSTGIVIPVINVEIWFTTEHLTHMLESDYDNCRDYGD